MTSPNQMFTHRRMAAAILLAACVGSSPVALPQDQSAAIGKDAIVARKTAMDTLSDKMDIIEAAIAAAGTKLNLDEGHANADVISVLLMAFPHLFPPSTNEWKPNVDRDPATDTYASPDIWTKYAGFDKQATTASKAASDASR